MTKALLLLAVVAAVGLAIVALQRERFAAAINQTCAARLASSQALDALITSDKCSATAQFPSLKKHPTEANQCYMSQEEYLVTQGGGCHNNNANLKVRGVTDARVDTAIDCVRSYCTLTFQNDASKDGAIQALSQNNAKAHPAVQQAAQRYEELSRGHARAQEEVTRLRGLPRASGTFMVRNPHKNLCMDDGDARWAADSRKFRLWPCDRNNRNQLFYYDGKTQQIKSAKKPNLCVDDGGARWQGQTPFHLYTCDPNNVHQKFAYNPNASMFQMTAKNNFCMDDGGGKKPGETQFKSYYCMGWNPHQKFVIDPA